MARQSMQRQFRKTYVVLGDGLTEQYYLNHLKGIKGYKYTIRPSLFTSITFETAETIIDSYLSGGCDQIIYLTDYDTIVNQDKSVEYEKFKKKYEDNDEVLICETMPCIEFWFLLHFHKTTREFIDAVQVTQELLKYITNYKKDLTFLEKPKWVNDLCSEGKLDIAIKNANIIMKEKFKGYVGKHFPFTKAYIAIEWFEKQKNE
jgi:hypothetical protein